jgi:glycosyltransferase involved in cell wall biosynthesis
LGTPVISTITLAVCARNAQDIIGACLESVKNQTVTPDEVLVAVDEPDDPTAEVARSYGARVIAAQSSGLYEARNGVLEACTTDYLAFTDADCTLVPQWIERVKTVLDLRPDVAAGTGRHPAVGPRTLASWLHHMWFVVETGETGETDGVIGGNSYFRTDALRRIGGWLSLAGHSAAEDVYISIALRKAGYGIWFEEEAAAQHCYETRLLGLWRKSVMMGKDIVVMLRAAGWKEGLWWYTLAIPVMALCLLFGLALTAIHPPLGLIAMAVPLAGSLAYSIVRFRGIRRAFPRWIARWLLIWPYSLGIVKGLMTPLPNVDASSRRGSEASVEI